MNKVVKWVLIASGVAVVGVAGFYGVMMVAVAAAFGAFDPTYTQADLIENYEARATQLRALNAYINTITPADKSVNIEFDGQRTLAIFHVRATGYNSSNWDVKWDSPKADSLLQQLGWTRQTLTTLYDKLDEADCISIASGEPSNIGYKRSGMGKFSYNIFAQPMSDSLSRQYSSSCTYIIYKPGVVLEYGGGAIGPQCFPGYQGKNRSF
ncbi:hypothetical protein [Hymenobacter aerophilus]|uniref:hypothetical protein n=1 Tax=Hymenobacter aerophilus TaxID=119644 RepID=UPI0003744E78|nr:hypothetical protein [Hymenobacter aerophilus]